MLFVWWDFLIVVGLPVNKDTKNDENDGHGR